MEPEGNPRPIVINNPVEVFHSILETVERGVRKLNCRSGEITERSPERRTTEQRSQEENRPQ